ncbi:MAG TPA: carbonic anhydrase [Polyangia bacterium]|jgi:carbonic anhydrase
MNRLTVVAVLLVVSTLVLAQPSHSASSTSASADRIWADLQAGNRRFVTGHSSQPGYVARRKALAKAQAPKVAVLGCADSRLSPELVFDQGLGDLFVVRNAGNSPDPITIGSLEYAVEQLGSKVIVVLGHQGCGAVKAACSGEKMPTANLAAVVAPIAPSCAASKHGDKVDLPGAIKDHVHQSAQQLVAQSPVLQHAIEAGKLKVIEAYYELDTGKVVRLK